MQIFYDTKDVNIDACVVALGFFDGVHIGHTELIKRAVAEAAKRGVLSVVYTFSRHPLEYLHSDKEIKYIYSQTEKADVLSSLGVDVVIFDDFSRVKDFSASDFVENILISRLNAKGLVCGFNFRFGKGGAGDSDTLRSLSSIYNCPLWVIAPVCAQGETVSSGRIRSLIEQGKMEMVSLLLGRPFCHNEIVCHGHKLGRTLGFPTANLMFHPTCAVPPRGVYFTITHYNGESFYSVTNIGTRPTVGDGQTESVCETYIIGFDHEVYGERISVDFYKMERPEIRFDSFKELSRALENDVSSALDYFKNEKEI